jgi:hypothetical protein
MRIVSFSALGATMMVLMTVVDVATSADVVVVAAADVAAADVAVDVDTVATNRNGNVDVDGNVDGPMGAGSDPSLHKSPLVFNFQMTEDVEDTDERLNQIQAALVMAANQAHNDPTTGTKFYGIFLKHVLNEDVTREASDDDDTNNNNNNNKNHKKHHPRTMFRGAGSSTGTTTPPTALGAVAVAVPVAAANRPCTSWMSYWTSKCRNTDVSGGSAYRKDFSTTATYGCNLCSPDDYYPRRNPTALTTTTTSNNNNNHLKNLTAARDKDIIARWQHLFCQNLRRINGFKTATKCFIHFDMEHQDPLDDVTVLDVMMTETANETVPEEEQATTGSTTIKN